LSKVQKKYFQQSKEPEISGKCNNIQVDEMGKKGKLPTDVFLMMKNECLKL